MLNGLEDNLKSSRRRSSMLTVYQFQERARVLHTQRYWWYSGLACMMCGDWCDEKKQIIKGNVSLIFNDILLSKIKRKRKHWHVKYIFFSFVCWSTNLSPFTSICSIRHRSSQHQSQPFTWSRKWWRIEIMTREILNFCRVTYRSTIERRNQYCKRVTLLPRYQLIA